MSGKLDKNTRLTIFLLTLWAEEPVKRTPRFFARIITPVKEPDPNHTPFNRTNSSPNSILAFQNRLNRSDIHEHPSKLFC